MTGAIQALVRHVDGAIARASLAMKRERPSLMVFMFHAVFENAAEMESGLIDPMQRTAVADFRALVASGIEAGYRFVTPEDIVDGIPAGERLALISFDDGYFNNRRVLPVLEEFGVPATFFIPTNFVRDGKGFWWDALYRERSLGGVPIGEIYREARGFKSFTNAAIESALREEFGVDVLVPRGNLDRAFSRDELAEFAAHPLVRLGNHTADHAILPNYSPSAAAEQIAEAQDFLAAVTGRAPVAIAYPNGALTPDIVAISAKAGLRVGVTMRPFKNHAGSADLMQLGRFATHGGEPVEKQFRTFRSDVQCYGALRSAYLRVFRPGARN